MSQQNTQHNSGISLTNCSNITIGDIHIHQSQSEGNISGSQRSDQSTSDQTRPSSSPSHEQTPYQPSTKHKIIKRPNQDLHYKTDCFVSKHYEGSIRDYETAKEDVNQRLRRSEMFSSYQYEFTQPLQEERQHAKDTTHLKIVDAQHHQLRPSNANETRSDPETPIASIHQPTEGLPGPYDDTTLVQQISRPRRRNTNAQSQEKAQCMVRDGQIQYVENRYMDYVQSGPDRRWCAEASTSARWEPVNPVMGHTSLHQPASCTLLRDQSTSHRGTLIIISNIQ